MNSGVQYLSDSNHKVRIMGILNITPDSFYDGGSYVDTDTAVVRALQMIDEGADVIDIGGESTRPGAAEISADEELDRVCPVIEKLSGLTDRPLSVDTRRAAVAAGALKLGASIINDISALSDPGMADVVSAAGAGLVLMHMRGTPQTMQQNTHYDDLVTEITGALGQSIHRARNAGIADRNIILDPGIGFGKSLEDNYRLLHAVPEFAALGVPLLIGLSRKSLIGRMYQQVVARLPGTIALNVLACVAGPP
jgi:dihydropteroate synthase